MSLTAAVVSGIVLCDEHTQERDLAALSTAELRPRRDRLVAALPQAAGFLAGVAGRTAPPLREGGMPVRARRTARAVCVPVGRGRLVYVPAVLADAVRAHLETSARLRGTLEQISAINLELLSRRELD